jgi:hypothetical protein
MGKLRFDINSTKVFETYGIVDIVFNGTNLASSKQLSTTVESLEYDADILTSSNNVLKIALLNDRAEDINGDGDYNDTVDKTMQVIVSALSYSIDNTNYITLLPQAATSYTVPSGPYAGNVLVLTESISQFISYGADHVLAFNSDGLVNSGFISGLKGKILENGNFLDLTSGKTYDINGNEVGAP